MIDGFAIGHHTADGDGWLTGTTVISAPDGAVGGVAVRGGGPGTRETDLLHPTALVERVDAVVLSGGSAFGLAAADGVVTELERRGRGFQVGPGLVVPIVPAAILFDLGRGGQPRNRPDAGFGKRALAAAGPAEPERGCVGAGTGAVCGGLKGGFGYAEADVVDGVRVAAAAAVNAAGSAVDPDTGRLWAGVRSRTTDPTPAERHALAAAAAAPPPALNTTIGVVLTTLTLTKAQATKVAGVAHDGLARAVRPVHSMVDGDAIFALSSGRHPPADNPYAALRQLNAVLGAAADVFAAACVDALLSAQTRGRWPAYTELVSGARG